MPHRVHLAARFGDVAAGAKHNLAVIGAEADLAGELEDRTETRNRDVIAPPGCTTVITAPSVTVMGPSSIGAFVEIDVLVAASGFPDQTWVWAK
jgi:hypothetical protein